MTRRMKVTKAILEAGCVKINFEKPYLLNSDIVSPIYCDIRILFSCPPQRDIVIEALIEEIKKDFPAFESLIGVPSSGIPYASILGDRFKMPFGYTRKKAKDHGEGKKLEGVILPGIKTVVIEDLVSSGESVIEAVNSLREVKADVVGIVSIVRNNVIAIKTEFIDLGIKYVNLTDMYSIAKTALQMELWTEEEYHRFLRYALNPNDESRMSKNAKENILQKRLKRRG